MILFISSMLFCMFVGILDAIGAENQRLHDEKEENRE